MAQAAELHSISQACYTPRGLMRLTFPATSRPRWSLLRRILAAKQTCYLWLHPPPESSSSMIQLLKHSLQAQTASDPSLVSARKLSGGIGCSSGSAISFLILI